MQLHEANRIETNEATSATGASDVSAAGTNGNNTNGNTGSTGAATASPPPKRSRLSKTIPTDRLVFSKQQDILRAYAAANDKAGGPVTIEELTGFIDMAPATISQANSFFTDTGLIIKEGRKFSASPELQSMFRLFPISQARAWAKLAPLMERAWFGQVLVPKLKFRAITEDDAVHDLAEASTAEKDHLPQLKLIIDYMVLVGLVQREGNLIRLVNSQDRTDDAGEKNKPEREKTNSATDPDQAEEGLERYSLTLDPKSKRRIVLHAPPAISAAELKRIQQWLSFQLIINDEGGPEK